MKYLIKLCNTYYKLAAEQLKLPFEKEYSNEEIEEIEGKFEEYLNSYETITFKELNECLTVLNIPFTKCPPHRQNPFGFKFKYKKNEYIVTTDQWPPDPNDSADDIYKLNDFIDNLSPELVEKYSGIDEDKFNDEFWSSPPTLYHGTTPSNLEEIKEDGLLPGSETRGISNRSVGSAVFCSTEPESARNYGTVLEIDTQKMKQDGLTPRVMEEPDILEYQQKETIAHACGIEDYHFDIEYGMDIDTVILLGPVPAKYIKIQDTGENIVDLNLEDEEGEEN